MSSNEQKFMDCGDGIKPGSSREEFPAPKQIEEILSLVNTVHHRLEDLSVEFKSKISQEQWQLTSSKSYSGKSWGETILPRTYFPESTLDIAFHHVLQHDKIFLKHLHNFVALFRGEQPLISDQELQGCSERVEPSIENHSQNSAISDKTITKNLRRSYKKLRKAKLNFDSTFVSFDSTLNGEPSSFSTSKKCNCRICSNMNEEMEGRKAARNKAGPRRKKRSKKLSRPGRILTRNRRMKMSRSLDAMTGKRTQVLSTA